MAKRYSGEIRLTISPTGQDTYEISLKAPGRKQLIGSIDIENGYTDLHGAVEAIDEAARQYLKKLFNEESTFLRQVAMTPDGGFHVGRSKSERWPGGPSNIKTKKGRDRGLL